MYGRLTLAQIQFQPTPPHEERLGIRGHDVVHVQNFNPRPRTRSDLESIRMPAESEMISTHAPARGATTPCIRRRCLST